MMMNVVTNASEAIPERSAGEVKVTVGRHALQPEDYRDGVVPPKSAAGNAASLSP
jgi:hypothetical protein